MRIKVEKWIIDDDSLSYKNLKIDKCCNNLVNSKNITINDIYTENNISDDEYSVKIIRNEYNYHLEEEMNYYEKINYCPFCGEKILIEIIKEIDKTKEYNSLCNQRDALWKKCLNTDSKNREHILRQQVKELDIKINNMLSSDNFKENTYE